MANRITNAMLKKRIEIINDMIDAPQEAYQKRDVVDGKPIGDLVANAGHCYLQGAYGGFQIEQMCEGGGASHLFGGGFETKREVYEKLNAYIDGFEAAMHKLGEPKSLTTYKVEAKVREAGALGAFEYQWFYVPAPNMYDRAHMIKVINGEGYELNRIRTVAQTDQGR